MLNVRANDNYNGMYDAGSGTKITTSVVAFNANNGLTSVASGSTYSGDHELNKAIGDGFKKAERLSIPITFAILLVAFGAFVAAGIPVAQQVFR